MKHHISHYAKPITLHEQRPIVWSIAGSDSGGGAGIQADLRAFNLFGVHGCTAIAALTAQNSTAVKSIEATSSHMLDAQLAALAEDLPPLVIKTGMLASPENVRVVAKWVDHLKAQNPNKPVALVVDPIRRASTGMAFADEALRQAMLEELIPRATLVKPNLKEALWLLTGQDHIRHDLTPADSPELAKQLCQLGAQAVIITGGDHIESTHPWAEDWLQTSHVCGWLGLPRIHSTTTHGTGCTFTASAAAALALGFCVADAAILAKMATTNAVQHGYIAGQGAGVAQIKPDFALQQSLIPYLRAKRASEPEPFAPLQDNWMGLYPVVDSSEWVKRVIDAGVKTVQLRIKAQDPRLLNETGQLFLSHEIKQSVEYARAAQVQFFVNDYWQLALEHGAYGVHLGQEDLPEEHDLAALRQAGIRLGVSTSSIWEVCIARSLNPSYYACGPVYETSSKDVAFETQGESNLAYWCHVLDKPVVAIAGITVERSQQVMRCGAQGAALISAITQAVNPEQAIHDLQVAIAQGCLLPKLRTPMLPHSIALKEEGNE